MAWMKVFSKSAPSRQQVRRGLKPTKTKRTERPTCVDDTGGLGRLGAHPNGPLPNLVCASGKKASELEGLSHGEDDLRQARLGAQLLALGRHFGLRPESREPVLEADGHGDDGVPRRVLLDPGVDLGQVLVLLPQVVLLGQVDEVDYGFGGEEQKLVDYFDLEVGWRVSSGKKKCGRVGA
jgi:hypothetical protein